METKKTIMDYETIALDDENSALVIIDQTKLPNETKILHLTTQKEIWDAIYLLQVMLMVIFLYYTKRQTKAD